MFSVMLVFVGGGLGAAGRYLVGHMAVRQFGAGFPYGTLTVNVVGSLLMGVLIGWLASRDGTSNELRLFLAVGFLGGFTTFSAFSLEIANMWDNGHLMNAFVYAVGSVLICLCSVFFGLWAARQIVS